MSGTVLLNSFLFGLGLAFESFMVSLANGLNNANTRVVRACIYAAVFAICHAAALIIGYALAVSIARGIGSASEYLKWTAVAVLAFLGVKMIAEGIRALLGHCEKKISRIWEFVIQSVVASFDAFAVGLTVPDYTVAEVAVCAAIISSVITVFYIGGFCVGKKFGTKLGKYAVVLGGLVFIGIAVEIAVGAF